MNAKHCSKLVGNLKNMHPYLYVAQSTTEDTEVGGLFLINIRNVLL